MQQLFEQGKLEVGCNYWASHAGTAMWHEWDADSVQQDLAAIAAQGMTVMRVFPLWPDFQPLQRLTSAGGHFIEMAMAEAPLPDTEAGQAGVNPVMCDRFRFLADCAAQHGIKLIVGLITGWMSGRQFVPPAFEGCGILSDPLAIRWQVRFVRYFVRNFRNHEAIAAWDLGNECNCLEFNGMNADKAWVWTYAIASAIRQEDSTRPVVSGMHSLNVNPRENWNLADQGELTDILTTHPYPLFTPHCSKRPFDMLPSTLHATAESCLYADITGIPCFPEEAGSLGPMIVSDEHAGKNLETALASAWAHDLGGFLWWCGFDQEHLRHAPYNWVALERELGLFRTDRSPKPTACVMKEFQDTLAALPFAKLPPRRIDAICLLTPDQDQWLAGFGAFQLAKQAGFDLRFAYSEAPLPESDFYIMPSVSGTNGITSQRWRHLLEKIHTGASLLVTEADGMLQPFRPVFGCRVDYRFMEPCEVSFTLTGSNESFRCAAPISQKLLADGCEILASDADGSPMLTRMAYGKGTVFFLNAPIEQHVLGQDVNYHKLYRLVWDQIPHAPRLITEKSPGVGVTEHRTDDGRAILVLINYTDQSGWAIAPDGARIVIPRNAMKVLIPELNPAKTR